MPHSEAMLFRFAQGDLETRKRPWKSGSQRLCHNLRTEKKWTARYDSSREAAQECSPRRKPWVESGRRASTEGAKEKLRHSLFQRRVVRLK